MATPLLNQKLIQTDILTTVEKDTICSLTIPSSSACLLIIAFHILWHIEMHDKADIGLVDSHPKGIGSDHDRLSVINEIILIAHTFFITQSCMIAGSRKSIAAQVLAHLLYRFSREAVYNTCILSIVFHILQKCLIFILRLLHSKIQIFAVKACCNRVWVIHIQQL